MDLGRLRSLVFLGAKPLPSTTDGSPSPTHAATRPLPATPAPVPGESAAHPEARQAPEAAAARRRTRAAALLATAKANDSPELEKAAAALAALDELLGTVDPSNAEAAALREKVRGYRRTFTNSIGMKFVECKPGEFMMGSPPSEKGHEVEEVQHKVTLKTGFMLGTYEVTQAEWKAVMKTDPSRFKGDTLPVESVSWDEAAAFCQKLSEKEGKRYRLPTEAEWEYACRAGTTTPFHSGATISTDQANYDGNVTYGSGAKGVYREKTTPVGTFPPNAWGLYDMHGNVWEWCQDWYAHYPPGDAADPKGPVNPPAADNASRVLRGGSWSYKREDCRSACRGRNAPEVRTGGIGFRVVLDSR